MPSPTHPRAVLFDFYGTLTQACTRGSSHYLVPRILGVDPDDYFALLDRTFQARCRGDFGDELATMGTVAALLSRRPSRARLRLAAAARLRAVRIHTRLREDAVSALSGLRRRGLRLAVVSDCGWELPQIMEALPVSGLLDSRVYSVHVGQCKPHPLMYQKACADLGIPAEDCVFVGDGGSRELTGALALGMRAIRLAAPDLSRHRVHGRDLDFRGPSAPSLSAAALSIAE